MLGIAVGLLLTESGQINHAVTIDDGAVTTEEDLPMLVELAAGDLNNDQLTYTIVRAPFNGTFNGAPPNLTFIPAADFNGNDSFIVEIDDGSPSTQLVSIELLITPVNDAPIFTIPVSAIDVTDESPAQTIANWAIEMAAGPPTAIDEVGQSISFFVTNGISDLFKEPPRIDNSGTLTFTPNPNVSGQAEILVWLQDHGGSDSSTSANSLPLSFTIQISKSRVWHNAANDVDVSNDGHVVGEDALTIINLINAFGSTPVPTDGRADGPYVDVTGDGFVAPEDALTVINYINAFGFTEAPTTPEGENSARPTAAQDLSSGPLSLESLISLLALDTIQSRRQR
jgi:hypothetical protein